MHNRKNKNRIEKPKRNENRKAKKETKKRKK